MTQAGLFKGYTHTQILKKCLSITTGVCMNVWWNVSFLHLQRGEISTQRLRGKKQFLMLASWHSSSWKGDNKSPIHCLVNSRWNLILAPALMNPPVPSASLQQQEGNSSSSIPAAQSLFIPILSKPISMCLCNNWSKSVCLCVECWWIRHYKLQHRESWCKFSLRFMESCLSMKQGHGKL